MLYPCMLCVALLMHLFVLCVVGLTVFVCSCACDPNERLSAPSICFVCVLYVRSYLLI